jgi:alpha-tubulin suppressor-like RCC1 family protein
MKEERAAAGKEAIEFLESKLKEAVERADKQAELLNSGEAVLNLAPTESGSSPMAMESSSGNTGFYRVARVVRFPEPGIVDGWGFNYETFPEDLTNAVAVSTGPRDPFAHMLILRSDGTVVGWAATNTALASVATNCNRYNQATIPEGLSNVVAIAAGGRHSVAAKWDGTVVVWGDNSHGQTNVPPGLTNVVDVKAGLWHSMALTSQGEVAAWGDLFDGPNPVPDGLSNVIAIAAGPRHCLALRNDHTVTAWGLDYEFL